MGEFKFTAKTDFGVFKDYWMFTLFEKRDEKKRRSGFVKYLTILCVIVAALVVLVVCNAVVMNNSLGVIPLILLGGMVAATISAVITATHSQPKKQYKLVRETVENPQKYVFTSTGMEVREYVAEEERESLAEFPYEKIVNAYETPKAFYLFISEVEAFLIAKNQLDAVNQDEFGAFLEEQLAGRYFKSKKS
ncbi:MAG: YcxB family protein [Christensenella sp.]